MEQLIVVFIILFAAFVLFAAYTAYVLDIQRQQIKKLESITGKGIISSSWFDFRGFFCGDTEEVHTTLTDKVKAIDRDLALLCQHLNVRRVDKAEARVIEKVKKTTNKREK